jgi:hypothetical protein
MRCDELTSSDPMADSGIRDPRFWSNLRGALSGESASERVAAHALVDCAGTDAIGAAREGFWRGSEPSPVPMALLLCAGAVALPLALRRLRRRPS